MNRKSEYTGDTIRRVHPVLNPGVILTCVVLIALVLGCVSRRTMHRDVTQHFREQAILQPYVCDGIFAAQPKLTMEVLVEQLTAQGAQLLCWDKEAGVASWCDTSGYLIPLPGHGDEVSMPGFDYAKGATWNGHVYGCARSVVAEEGSWLVVYVRGRDMGEGRRIFSDGTYEWRLLRSVERSIHQIATGQRTVPEILDWKASPTMRGTETYADLFRTHFADLPEVTAQSVSAKSPGIQYPVDVDRLWGASLDVITQYDLVPYVNSTEHVIVFSRRVSVPSDVNSIHLTAVDVVMAVSIQGQEKGACTMHMAVLGEQDLKPRPIVQQSSGYSEGVVTELTGTPSEIAAAMVSSELERHIDFQLLYNENWGNKLLRHMSQ